MRRCLNRAFTQTLFNGRSHIELSDVMLSIISEKKSHAAYYCEQAGIEKEKFAAYLSSEVDANEEDEEMSGAAAAKALTCIYN